jgi:hypothetical protein
MFHTCGCVAQPGTQTQTAEEVKYTLYIGLNDKNTYTQLLSTEDAVNRVADIALKYVDGFTQLSGKGAYKDEKGIITHENCLIFHKASRLMISIFIRAGINQQPECCFFHPDNI